MADTIGGMLAGHRAKGKMKGMEVSVYVPHRGEVAMAADDMKWIKRDLKDEEKRLKDYQSILDNWVPEDVAARAKADVEKRKKECGLRIAELKGRLKLHKKMKED